MTEDQIAEKTAADKRKALLALAADQGGEAGACLDSTAMAAFVTGACSAEEKRQALRHVSLCRRCYGEWLVLAEMQMEQKRGQRKAERIPFYLKPANLAALVSAMAAAICVGLFLDINPFGYRIEPSVESITPIQQDRELPAEEQQPPVAKESVPENAGARREQPQPLPQTAIPGMIEQQHEAGSAEKAKGIMPDPMPAPASPPPRAMLEKSAPLPAAADQAAGTPDSGGADADREVDGLASEATTLSTWEEQLLSACRHEQQTGFTSADRQALFQTGKRSLRLWQREQQATAGTSRASSPLLSILLQAEDKEQLFARCGEILAIAEDVRR